MIIIYVAITFSFHHWALAGDVVHKRLNLDGNKIHLQDSNKDGKIDRRISEKQVNANKILVHYERDKNQDGTFEIQYFQYFNLNQEKNNHCPNSFSSLHINQAEFHPLLEALISPKGYIIDPKCLKNWGKHFPSLVEGTMKTGLQCLKDLHKNNQSYGSYQIETELKKVQQGEKTIHLTCSEDDYNWEGTLAHASTKEGQEILVGEKKIPHPYISFNPGHKLKNVEDQDKDILDLKKLIFHEHIHNLGFRHHQTIEYPYACEYCCFPDEEDGDEIKIISCKICKGDYAHETDIEYVKDIVKFSKLTYKEKIGRRAVIKYMKENKENLLGLSLLAWSLSDVFNPVGYELVKIIAKNHKSEVTKEEMNIFYKFIIYDNHSQYEKISQILSKSYYQLYFKQDSLVALNQLTQNKEYLIKELSTLKSSSNQNEQYVSDHLKTLLDDIIYDLWINKYNPRNLSDSKVSDGGYELYQFFNEN